jgi:ATP-dependent Clp protease protease subunit
MILEIEKPSMLFDKIFIENLKERKIIYNEEITGSVIEFICSQVAYFNRIDDNDEIPIEKRKPIEIHLNSYGGSVYDGFAAVNSIITSKTPVHTYVSGYVMSMAFGIFIAGHKRFAYPYSNFMYHEISTLSVGKNQEIERVTLENKRLQKMYDRLVTSRTSIDQKRLDKIKKSLVDWFFDAEEALKLGVVHEIIQ